jgi:hypothetical protein
MAKKGPKRSLKRGLKWPKKGQKGPIFDIKILGYLMEELVNNFTYLIQDLVRDLRF